MCFYNLQQICCILLQQILFTLRMSNYNAGYFVSFSQISALYFLGMAGHFALGNSNSLATIDVAGAFIVRGALHQGLFFQYYFHFTKPFNLPTWLSNMSGHRSTLFQGISSHSTLLSGVLMFIITYASPLLVLFALVVYMSVKGCLVTQNVDSGHLLQRMLGFPCLVPLTLNSILLTAYTIVLLLMRNHLFVWSVFSPK